MDIRRLPLWESRNATLMSNDQIRVVLEDQGEVVLELSAKSIQGGLVNALSLPYFRGTGIGVESDPNADFWKGKQRTYQAGGIYFTFPDKNEDHITTQNSYWVVRRYGTESQKGGVWRLSETKSREEGNRYHIKKVELILPGQPVLYTSCTITNTGTEPLEANLDFHSMYSSPFLESGCLLNSCNANFVAFTPNFREVAINRLQAGQNFNDLKHAPSLKGGYIDLSYISGATGSYDYIMGSINQDVSTAWTSIINPRQQLLAFNFFPGPRHNLGHDVIGFSNIDFSFNLAGRMDMPWALYEGGTPQVFSLTTGEGVMDHKEQLKGANKIILQPNEAKTIYMGHAFTSFDNPRIGLGFSSVDFGDSGVVLRRTKSYAHFAAEHSFESLRKLTEDLRD